MINTSQYKQHAVKKITVNDQLKASNKMSEEFDYTKIKLYDRSVVKTKREIAHQLLQEYFYDSSIHGMKYFSNLQIKSSIIGKLFWTSIIICSFVCK